MPETASRIRVARLLLKSAGDVVDVVSHDWWLYMVVTGCGGEVYYDPYPSLRYRQHPHNAIGVNSSWLARWRRGAMMFKGRFQTWSDLHIAAIQRIHDKLTPSSQEALSNFSIARKASFAASAAFNPASFAATNSAKKYE